MSEKMKKIQVAKITVFITSIFVIFLSVTYALVGQVLTGSKRQVVTAGDIRIRLDEKNEITINNAMPVYDEVGMIGTPFKFQVVNDGSSKANYILKLIDITTGDASNKLSPSLVRYGLTKDEETTIKNLSSAFSGSIDKGSISGNQTISYELRLWIDFNVEDESLIKDKTIKYKIGIEVEQPRQYAKYDAMIRSRVDSTYFWKYDKQIRSIVFEPKINIPEGVESWDVSYNTNSGQVMAYVEDLDETVTVNSEVLPAYKLHIQAKNGVAVNTSCSSMFSGFSNLTTIDGLEYFDISRVSYATYWFSSCYSLTSIDLSNLDFSNMINISNMFSNCRSLKTIVGLEYIDTSKVTNMSNMFYGCNSLDSLDLSHFNTSSVTDMGYMFSGCSSLDILDLSHFDTSKVTSMSRMFNEASSLRTIDLSMLDVSKVKNVDALFGGCENLESVNLSGLNLDNVTSFYYLFGACKKLKEVNLTGIIISNLKNASQMFENCQSLVSIDLSSLNFSKVTDMHQIFSKCSSLVSLDLSYLDTSSVTNMGGLFADCTSLTTLNLDGFDTSNVTGMSNMFSDCSSLTDLNIGSFDFTNVSKYAMFQKVSPNCLITVKDDAAKAWVLGISPGLTNIVVKNA